MFSAAVDDEFQDSKLTNEKAFKFYRRVTKDKQTFHIPHNLLLSLNLRSDVFETEGFEKSYKPFPFFCTMPAPINKPKSIHVEDTSLLYNQEKENWKQEMEIIKLRHRSIKNIRVNEISKNPAVVPAYLLKFARLLREDPDPYFNSPYNWYCSGAGNLQYINLFSSPSLLHSVNHILGVYKFGDNQQFGEVIAEYICENKQLIHETIVTEFPNKNIICLRQKHSLSLIESTNNEDGLCLNMLKKINSEKPFSSVTSDGVDSICYSCVDDSVNIYSAETGECLQLSTKSDSFVINNWSSVQFMDLNTIIKTNARNVVLIDKRSIGTVSSILPVLTLDCDILTSSKISRISSNYVYAGSNHSIHLFDLRSTKSSVSKWTHGFKSPPLYICPLPLDQHKELVCLSGQRSDESCALINNFGSFSDDAVNYIDDFLPFQQPCIVDTFKSGQKKGICLDPTLNLKKRFNASVTGISHVPNDERIKLLILNSVGDVFCQCFYPEKTADDFGDYLNIWEESFKPERFQFTISSKMNVSHCHRAFKRESRITIKKGKLKKGFLIHKKRWRSILTRLKEYVDISANELLSVWDLGEERGIDKLVSSQLDPEVAVNNWMDGALSDKFLF